MSQRPPRPRGGYLRPWIWLIYGALALVGIPWYWPRDSVRLVLGLPAWALVSILASMAVSVFTAWLLWNRWPVDDADVETGLDAAPVNPEEAE